MHDKYASVVKILHSEASDLMSLAILSGRDPFRFYNGADLTSLDLTNQNLTGLNFDGADLRFAHLEGASFDKGSLNRSVLDAAQLHLKDGFEFNYQDVLQFPGKEILMFCMIRSSLIDEILIDFGINYSVFAEFSKISTGALRKARVGKVIAIETAQLIFNGVFRFSKTLDSKIGMKCINSIEQPCAKMLVGGNNKPFVEISAEDVHRLFEIRRRRIAHMKRERGTNASPYVDYRDTAEYLMFYKHLVDDIDFWTKFDEESA
ncbi:pentapeptide repeat-containing protein [Novosphingobium sp. ZW T3_23]|uniref:pentapeptide repeat-containing protein n=1 Tax=Novosphingobium sp. ZW T3_23 TaxID=3378084 RepID=UPI0038523F44